MVRIPRAVEEFDDHALAGKLLPAEQKRPKLR